MNSPKRLLHTAWRPGLVIVSLMVIAYLLYFHNIQHLLPGYDQRELKAYAAASNWHTILGNPVNLPYKAIVWSAVALGHHSLLTTRLVASSFAIVAALLFYAIAYRWHGYRTTFLATIMFATSAGFLHIARLGSPQILQMGVLLYLALLVGYRHLRRYRSGLTYLLLLAMAILLYVPGFVWLELLGIVLLSTQIRHWLRQTSKIHVAGSVLVFLLAVSPLTHAAFKHSLVLRNMVGLPANLHVLTAMPDNLLHTLLAIGIRSPGSSEFYVGHAPLLDVVSLALSLLGAYYYARVKRNRRSLFLFGSLMVSLLLVSLGGVVTIAMVVPLLYLFTAAGLDGLLKQWLTVFPTNPIAKYLGIGLVFVMVAFSVLYQTRSYFVAWPHNVQTEQTFRYPQP